jgi:hypothetical protein
LCTFCALRSGRVASTLPRAEADGIWLTTDYTVSKEDNV